MEARNEPALHDQHQLQGNRAANFRNLNPKDVGAWPVMPRAAALIGAFRRHLAGRLGLRLERPARRRFRHANRKSKSLSDEFVSQEDAGVSLDLYTQQLNDIDRSFGALLKQLPNKAEVESLLIEINQSGMGRGLQFELFKPGAEIVKDFYAELPINVRLTGSYHDFGAFAGDIGRLSRIVTLNNISITASTQAKDGTLVLDAVTKTFRYLDEEELAAKRRAAQAAKGGKK